MIYTSYFANWRKLQKLNIQIISIARVNPPKLACPIASMFAPSQSLLSDIKRGNITWEDYTERYIKELEMLEEWRIESVLALYEKEYKNIALCCYEKPTDNCHRHILAEYLSAKLDIDIEEF